MNSFELVINKSRFIAYRVELTNLEQVKEVINNLKKEHKKAKHVCFAYVFKGDVVSEKCSDDGEPGGTAGYPILNVIKKKNLTNTLVAVVRYFGGIKLGAGGLVRAYTSSVTETLKNAITIPIVNYENIMITFPYEYTKVVDKILENEIIINKKYDELVTYEIKINILNMNEIKEKLKPFTKL